MKFRLRPCEWATASGPLDNEAMFDMMRGKPRTVLYDVELKTGYIFWRRVAARVSMAEAQTAMTEIQTAYLTYEIK